VVHERVGISAQDAVFGDVVVNWHNTPVVNLYLTTVTLENTTVTNFTNLEFKVFTGTETLLLNERGEIENTTDIPATTKVLAQPRIRHLSFQSPAARHPSVSHDDASQRQCESCGLDRHATRGATVRFLVVAARSGSLHTWVAAVVSMLAGLFAQSIGAGLFRFGRLYRIVFQ